MGDIDFLVLPEHFERARILMLENNYKPLDEGDSRHIEFQKNGEYSRAVKPPIRQARNRLSGLTETAYASLLA